MPTAMANITQAKCILVTGATSGIGRALALAIHDLESKPTVIAVGRRQDRLDELAKRLVEVAAATGRRVRVALEPEPGCVVSTTRDAIRHLRTVDPDWLGGVV